MTSQRIELKVLEDARKLLAKGWCQKFSARLLGEIGCSAISPLAVEFCLTGAIIRVIHDRHLTQQTQGRVMGALAKALPKYWKEDWSVDHGLVYGREISLERFNDSRPSVHSILALIDRAKKSF